MAPLEVVLHAIAVASDILLMSLSTACKISGCSESTHRPRRSLAVFTSKLHNVHQEAVVLDYLSFFIQSLDSLSHAPDRPVRFWATVALATGALSA